MTDKDYRGTEQNHGRITHRRRFLQHWRIIAAGLMVYDLIMINLSYLAALFFRFDLHYSEIPGSYMQAFLGFAPIYTIFCLVLFWCLRLYNSIWRFASYDELIHMVVASVISTAFHVAGITVLFERMPASYYITGSILQFFLLLGIRFSYRFVLMMRHRNAVDKRDTHAPRIMLIGAGNAGQMLLKDFRRAQEMQGTVCCLIDDNPNKRGRFIEGVRVAGDRNDILSCVEKYRIDTIYVALPSATAEQRRDILNICKETGCELKNLPGYYQLLNGEVTISAMKDVDIVDLLGRDPIKVDLTEIFDYLRDKVILVTGGGGSIGSELIRQIASHHPKKLIVLDIYENNAYEIQQELIRKYPELDLEVVIASVRDSRRMHQIMARYRPHIVFHAAAHKHVPLMEDSPNEAIKNNVFGTWVTAYAAVKNGVDRFVLISTDKAVNPTNIMGASKRMCEMIIQLFDQKIRENRIDELPDLSVNWNEVARVSGWTDVGGADPADRAASNPSDGIRAEDDMIPGSGTEKNRENYLATSGVATVPEDDIPGTETNEVSERREKHVAASASKRIQTGDIPDIEAGGMSGRTGLHAADNAAGGCDTGKTEFVAVRFGNVLGSNGSVIPLFRKQIAEGGPVTVTHPDIIRYFMTIPEAVSLVLQASVYAKGGEIFVLDMGDPVKIDTLARNLIKLSGYRPDEEIKISYTGLRPGEKLYEEKLMAEEGMRTTPNRLIHIGNPIAFDGDAFLRTLVELKPVVWNNAANIRELVENVVPTYHPVE